MPAFPAPRHQARQHPARAADGRLVLAEPVAASDGRVLSVLILRLLASSVAAILDEVRHGSALTPFLIDRDGVVIHHLIEQEVYSSPMPLPPATQAAHALQAGDHEGARVEVRRRDAIG